mmetsp:Transcript_46735/g.84367  ORF Transcript_46735/g.84367 Transcript_46735/m.84367 type:complete len:267 (-) Transcript_46735:133-933(-)
MPRLIRRGFHVLALCAGLAWHLASWASTYVSAEPGTAYPRRTGTRSRRRNKNVVGLVLDLETTSLNRSEAEICQIAIVHSIPGSESPCSINKYVMPEGDIDPNATKVHGLDRHRLQGLGAKPFAEAWDECEDWLNSTFGNSSVFVWAAHNGDSFDWPILKRYASSKVLAPPRGVLIDTVHLARDVLKFDASIKNDLKLASLYRHATGGDGLLSHHSALADSRATSLVWHWLVEKSAKRKKKHGADFQQHLELEAETLLFGPKGRRL